MTISGATYREGIAYSPDGAMYVTVAGGTLDPSAVVFGAEDSVTAFATGGQTNATALSATKSYHRISVCATAADSVKLPAATVGQAHYIRNDGAAAAQVFGQATETINGVASATGISLAVGVGMWFICTTAGAWTTTFNSTAPGVIGGTTPAAITGTTITANTAFATASATVSRTSAKNLAAPFILGKSSIPFIGLSSGSVAANGAISGITALPLIYASAYCYFPANALATSIAAGWYYCTFSSTTAGTAFLNTYTSGVPTIPGSPTAVTDGKGAFTGDTSERVGVSISVPANSLAANGALAIEGAYNYTNSGNNKTFRIRVGGIAGTVIHADANVTTQLNSAARARLANRGATNVQVGSSMVTRANGSLTTAPIQAAIDTTGATTIDFTAVRATATDNTVWEDFQILLLSDGT